MTKKEFEMTGEYIERTTENIEKAIKVVSAILRSMDLELESKPQVCTPLSMARNNAYLSVILLRDAIGYLKRGCTNDKAGV